MPAIVKSAEARTLNLTVFPGNLYERTIEVMVPPHFDAYVMPVEDNRDVNHLLFTSSKIKPKVCYGVEIRLEDGVAMVSPLPNWDDLKIYFGGQVYYPAPISEAVSLMVWLNCKPPQIQGVCVF